MKIETVSLTAFKTFAISLVAAFYLHVIAARQIPSLVMPNAPNYREVNQLHEPERLWERAIAAKGGREALHGVRNLVISVRGEYGSRRLKKNQIRQEVLYVLPSKLWSWSDYRPDVFGLRVEMYNYDKNTKYIISDRDSSHSLELINDADRRNRDLLLSLLPYLPETRWLKPELVEAKKGRIGTRPVNIVRTTAHGTRVDFALDQKTHLPVRVSYYSVDKNKTYITSLDLSDYVEIAGIKLPQTIKYDDDSKDKQSYSLNVEYDESIFLKPPPIEAGLEAWKKKKD